MENCQSVSLSYGENIRPSMPVNISGEEESFNNYELVSWF